MFNEEYKDIKENYLDGMVLTSFQEILEFWEKQSNYNNFDNSDCVFITSDIHGDLNALLNFLLGSKFVKFKDRKNLSKEYVVNESYSAQIPNLVIDKNYQKSLFILGDLIDRGAFSNECFYLVKDIIDQIDDLKEKDEKAYNNLKDRFQYIVGNHELLTVLYGYSEISNEYKGAYIIGDNNDYRNVRNELYKLILAGRIKLSTNISKDLVGSHSAFKLKNMLKFLNFVNDEKIFEYSLKCLASKCIIMLDDGYIKLPEEEKLKLIVETVNQALITVIDKLTKSDYVFCNRQYYEKFLNLLLHVLTKESDEKDLNNFFQVVGHELSAEHLTFEKLNTLYIDLEQSSGFFPITMRSYPAYVVFDKETKIFSTVRFCRDKTNTSHYERVICQQNIIPNLYLQNINKKLDANEALTQEENDYVFNSCISINDGVLKDKILDSSDKANFVDRLIGTKLRIEKILAGSVSSKTTGSSYVKSSTGSYYSNLTLSSGSMSSSFSSKNGVAWKKTKQSKLKKSSGFNWGKGCFASCITKKKEKENQMSNNMGTIYFN